MGWYRLDSSGLEMESACEHGNESLGPIKRPGKS
jgi:hypothetical protein